MSFPVWPHVASKVVWSQMGLVPEGGGGSGHKECMADM